MQVDGLVKNTDYRFPSEYWTKRHHQKIAALSIGTHWNLGGPPHACNSVPLIIWEGDSAPNQQWLFQGTPCSNDLMQVDGLVKNTYYRFPSEYWTKRHHQKIAALSIGTHWNLGGPPHACNSVPLIIWEGDSAPNQQWLLQGGFFKDFFLIALFTFNDRFISHLPLIQF